MIEEKHNPRYKYDCPQCKFSWCCGPLCRCLLYSLSRPPPKRMKEVKKEIRAWLKKRGDRVSEKELDTYI